jgi:hypothetical protein
MKKGRSIYLTHNEQVIISVALDHLSKWHQEKYEEETRLHEFDRHNIDEHHLECMLEIRDLVDYKLKIKP